MINIINKQDCCGCNACGDICSKNAITFQKDEEGFLYPVVDKEKCVDCGLCDKICPNIHSDELKKNDFEKPKCFAAIHKNLEVRFDSTSGGAFSALAKKAYLQKWYVGGAIWNEDWSVSQFISNNKKDLERLRSSKYIQSDARGIYKQIKDLLVAGEHVLICGTPCQIAGLKSYLRKDYENLVTVDFICQYVNSPLIWKKYIDYLEKEHNSKVVYIKDKNKEIGWKSLCNKVVFENGDVIYDTKEVNHFRRCYMQLGVASRPACYKCKFKGFPRIADITVADYWGGEKQVPKEWDNNLGTSLIMCNSQKGLDYLDDKVRKYLDIKDVAFESTLGGNAALTRQFSPDIKFNREDFYKDLEAGDIKTVVNDYILRYNTSPKQIVKKKIRNVLRFVMYLIKATHLNPFTVWTNIYHNFLNSNIHTNVLEGSFLILYPHCILQINKTAKININGFVRIGENYFRGEKRYSKILLRKKATLNFNGPYIISTGCDIQVHNNATFTIEGGGDSNVNLEVICGQNITFQKYVYIGRNVIIRDTNGEHFLSRQGYKCSRPVTIGTHAWLCDRATIMPGVHVHPGGIVGASTYVTSDVPAFSMVSGNPARIVDEEVYWKA